MLVENVIVLSLAQHKVLSISEGLEDHSVVIVLQAQPRLTSATFLSPPMSYVSFGLSGAN